MGAMARLRRVDRDLAAVTVLALLLQGPRHTYEMHRLIVDTHKDFVTGLPRRLYHAVERLERDGLIGVVEHSRAGSRPERTIYRLTEQGRSALTDRVYRLLATPDRDATLLVAGLSLIGCLPVDRAGQALAERAEALARAVRQTEDQLRSVPAELPRVLLLEAEYELTRLGAERDWVRARLAELDSGELAWPADLRRLMPIEEALDDLT
ncbi:PadR family transcriptional regulator [Amycolatopsis cihanbeyliensis]|uniref:PadR family transcriptional regulator n=1 Tax=Amycolatopsis cihanbeyliensis TaxID=1128664 RepID=A0A542DMG6_AMYCI|nr:helix-turn-helix transcriptional regulator [Amycolatopsis cihanbeyliensis]TQJ04291.1 PadR family transcriptional regulator [Amycolatopsis cihanbeyliensis]